MDSPKVNSMIQEHLIEEANLHFTDFVRDLLKFMVNISCFSVIKRYVVSIQGEFKMFSPMTFVTFAFFVSLPNKGHVFTNPYKAILETALIKKKNIYCFNHKKRLIACRWILLGISDLNKVRN